MHVLLMYLNSSAVQNNSVTANFLKTIQKLYKHEFSAAEANLNRTLFVTEYFLIDDFIIIIIHCNCTNF